MNRREFVAMAPAFPVAAVTASLTLREEGKDLVELDVSVLKCQPGDVLVLKCDGSISQDTAARIQSYVEQAFNDRVKAIVLSSGLTLEGVLRAP